MKTTRKHYARSLLALLSSVSILASSTALGAIHFTLQGSEMDSHLGLQTQETRSASASIGTDLGSYFRIGLTHREDISNQEGWAEDKGAASGYAYSRTRQHLRANSVDLTLILYYGELFVPYLMAGAIKKQYVTEFSVATDVDGAESRSSSSLELPVLPNFGAGLGIRLNREFSLKLSYSVSPGIVQNSPVDSDPRSILDKMLSVGISYDL